MNNAEEFNNNMQLVAPNSSAQQQEIIFVNSEDLE